MPPKKQSKTNSIIQLWQKQQLSKVEKTSSTDYPEIITLDASEPACNVSPGCSRSNFENLIDSKKSTPNASYHTKPSTPGSLRRRKAMQHAFGGLEVNEDQLQFIHYPIYEHIRPYEVELVKSCISLNTCMCLPFGISTNSIIATVFDNFLRWFPDCRLVFCYPTIENAHSFIEICKLHCIPDNEISLIPVYQNFKKLSEKNAKVVVTTPQCMIKVLENEPNFYNKIRCISLFMDPGENAAKYKKIIGPLLSRGVTFRVIVSLPSFQDGSRRTSSIAKRQQIITSLMLSQWEELSALSKDYRCSAVPLGIEPHYWKYTDLSSTIVCLMDSLEEIVFPMLESLRIDFQLPHLTLKELFNFRWDIFSSDKLSHDKQKSFNLCKFFFDAYRALVLFGPRALWLCMTDFLNDKTKALVSEEVQMYIISDQKVSCLFNKVQEEFSSFHDAKSVHEKVSNSHIKFTILRSLLAKWFNLDIPQQGVILCGSVSTGRAIAESLVSMPNIKVLLVSDSVHGLCFPHVSTVPITRLSGIFFQEKQLVLILPLCLENSLSSLDTCCSNGLKFVIATERDAVCLLEHEVVEHVALLSQDFENFRKMDGRLIKDTEEPIVRRSLGGRVGVVDKYHCFKFEPSRLSLNADRFRLVAKKNLDDVAMLKTINTSRVEGKKNLSIPKKNSGEYMTDEEKNDYAYRAESSNLPVSGLFAKRRVLGEHYPPSTFSSVTYEDWALSNRLSNNIYKSTLSTMLTSILRDEEPEIFRRRKNFNYDTSLINKEKIRKYKNILDKLNSFWYKF